MSLLLGVNIHDAAFTVEGIGYLALGLLARAACRVRGDAGYCADWAAGRRVLYRGGGWHVPTTAKALHGNRAVRTDADIHVFAFLLPASLRDMGRFFKRARRSF